MSGPALTVGLQPLRRGAPPEVLIDTARRAEAAGCGFLTVSDHFHPWTRRQGQSPFVWAVLGAIAHATERIPVGTAVTCPTIRTHPAIVAHAAATTATMLPGRFFLGVGTGERLNETGHGRPLAVGARASRDARGGGRGQRVVDRRGRARAPGPPLHRRARAPVHAPRRAAAGRRVRLRPAGRRDGRAHRRRVHARRPEAELLETFRAAGGARKPSYGKLDTCVAASDAEARRSAHETWPPSALGGEIGQELATPEHYEQATAKVTEDHVADAILCRSAGGQAHLEALGEYAAAVFDHVTVQQCGRDQARLIALHAGEVLPDVMAPTGRRTA